MKRSSKAPENPTTKEEFTNTGIDQIPSMRVRVRETKITEDSIKGKHQLESHTNSDHQTHIDDFTRFLETGFKLTPKDFRKNNEERDFSADKTLIEICTVEDILLEYSANQGVLPSRQKPLNPAAGSGIESLLNKNIKLPANSRTTLELQSGYVFRLRDINGKVIDPNTIHVAGWKKMTPVHEYNEINKYFSLIPNTSHNTLKKDFGYEKATELCLAGNIMILRDQEILDKKITTSNFDQEDVDVISPPFNTRDKRHSLTRMVFANANKSRADVSGNNIIDLTSGKHYHPTDRGVNVITNFNEHRALIDYYDEAGKEYSNYIDFAKEHLQSKEAKNFLEEFIKEFENPRESKEKITKHIDLALQNNKSNTIKEALSTLKENFESKDNQYLVGELYKIYCMEQRKNVFFAELSIHGTNEMDDPINDTIRTTKHYAENGEEFYIQFDEEVHHRFCYLEPNSCLEFVKKFEKKLTGATALSIHREDGPETSKESQKVIFGDKEPTGGVFRRPEKKLRVSTASDLTTVFSKTEQPATTRSTAKQQQIAMLPPSPVKFEESADLGAEKLFLTNAVVRGEATKIHKKLPYIVPFPANESQSKSTSPIGQRDLSQGSSSSSTGILTRQRSNSRFASIAGLSEAFDSEPSSQSSEILGHAIPPRDSQQPSGSTRKRSSTEAKSLDPQKEKKRTSRQ